MGGGIESFKLLIMLALSDKQPHSETVQESTKSCLIRTKGTLLITQELPRDLGALLGTKVKEQMLEQKMFLLSLGYCKSFRICVPETRRYLYLYLSMSISISNLFIIYHLSIPIISQPT